MANLLRFDNPLEFMLRYTVIIGMVLAIIGLSICFMSKRITMAVRKEDEVNNNDKLLFTLRIVGICLILVGLIVIALPINATFYKA